MTYPKLDRRHVPTCVDLFSGAGGLTLGFCRAGGLPLAAVDSDPASIETYSSMFPMTREIYQGDIKTWHPETDLSKATVMIGGPPCQGFSLARGLRFVDDPRNNLYEEFIRLIARFQPEWVVMENVTGITNIGKGSILRQIYEDFNEAGYWLDHRVINMADYGVPQARKRTIFVGSRVSSHFSWPAPTHVSRKHGLGAAHPYYVSVGEALSDLNWPHGKYFSHRANSQMRGPRNRHVMTDPAFTLRTRGDEFALCAHPATGAFSPGPMPESETEYFSAKTNYQLLMRETPPEWIEDYEAPEVCDGEPQDLKGTRRLTIRELARLQSFPDWFAFSGSPYTQGRQIGNAVPPLFAEHLFHALLKQSSQAHTIQDATGSTLKAVENISFAK